MVSILDSAIGAIVGVVGIMVFAYIWAALNKEILPAGVEGIVNVVPIVLAAVILIGIVVTGLYFARGR